MTQSDGTDDPKFTGVLSNSKDNKVGHEAGDKVSVIIGGICVANVTNGVAVGNGLGPSATQGAGTSGGSSAEAFSDQAASSSVQSQLVLLRSTSMGVANNA